jgi:hypothetical protein
VGGGGGGHEVGSRTEGEMVGGQWEKRKGRWDVEAKGIKGKLFL